MKGFFENGTALILTAGRDRATPESGAIPSGVDKSPEGATEKGKQTIQVPEGRPNSQAHLNAIAAPENPPRDRRSSWQ